MDRMKIDFSNLKIDGMGDRITQTRSTEVGPQMGTPSIGASPTQVGTDFSKTLSNAINQVNTAHLEADKKSQDLATGRTQNLHDVMIAMEKADLSLRLMVQVRNKMIEAYQEIIKMQV